MTEKTGEGTATWRSRAGSLGSILFLLTLSWGAYLGLRPLRDNSFLTHLATGRLILDRGSVPSADPYSFTAEGASWTVQSWLPSVAYAAAERAGGAFGLRLLFLGVFVVATVLVWALTREARSVIPRLLVVSASMAVAVGTWVPRPYMVGFIGLALVWLAMDGRVPGWTLLPFGWLWANSHGSFPLGLALCGTILAGAWLDGHGSWERRIGRELRVAAWLAGGFALGVVSPLGVQGSLFPVRAVLDSGAFESIVEWQSPAFRSVPQRVFLVLFMLAVVAVVRTRRWRHVLPLLLFGALSLLAMRNIVMALPVLAAVTAAGAPAVGTLRSSTRPALGVPVAAASGALVALLVVAGFDSPAVYIDGYPTRALAWVAENGGPGRMATQDFTGNLLEALDGDEASVFIDDRADMYPSEVVDDFLTLNRANPGWSEVLEDRGIGTVVWHRNSALASVLASDPGWLIAFSDARWVVAHRRSTA